MQELLHYLKTRRSALALTLTPPAPDAEQLKQMITIASRVPDHCKLAPWRFVEYPKELREKLAASFLQLSDEDSDVTGKESRKTQIERFRQAPMVIAVISKPVEHPKVPEWEQVLSAGAASMQLLVAANAMCFGAQWLTGFYVSNPKACELLGVRDGERIAAMVHIGTAPATPTDRTRPEIADIFTRHTGQEL